MIKVLAIIGSPRKRGNTDMLVSNITEGAKSAGAQVETLYLGDLNIKECDGCHRCWQGKECSKDDDMRGIYKKIIESDVIIFGTPVYWYGPTGLMKMLIDRFVYFNCPETRAKIKGKKAVVAIVLEEENPDTYRPVVEFFEKCLEYLEMPIVGKIIVPGVSARGDIVKKEAVLRQAHDLGEMLTKGIWG